MYLPTVCSVTPFHKEIENLLNPNVCLLVIEPLLIENFHHTRFLQLNYPHHIANHVPALTKEFSDFSLASLTSYFEGGRDKYGCDKEEWK